MMKLGILGAGKIAIHMADTVAGMKDVEAYAIAARSEERARHLPRSMVLPGPMALMRKCWQIPRWIWSISQRLIPIIICMRKCVWKQERMSFVRNPLP